MKLEFRLFHRREFVGFASKLAAATGMAGLARGSRGGNQENFNPLAFDAAKYEKTDSKLIACAEVARWKCGRQDPKRLAIGPAGEVYVCAGDYLSCYSAQGDPKLEIALSGLATCAAVAPDGSLYVGARNHIEIFDSNGARRAAWEPADRKSWLTGLAIGADDVFAADSAQRVIWRYDKAGRRLGRIADKSDERNAPGLVLPSPYLEVLLHPDGLLRVNNIGRHQVEAYTRDGDFEGAWGHSSAAIDGFCGCCNPIGLGLLPDGRFLTCEKGLPRVKLYSAEGKFDSVVAGVESFPENARACSGLNDCAHGGLHAAVGTNGRIFILDMVAGEVRVMQPKV